MKLVDYRIECERLAFEATKNPLHAWAAYGVARQAKVAIPEWVLAYLDKCRLGLVFTVPDAIEERGSAKDLGPVIAGAFGLVSKGRGNPFEYDERWWAIGRTIRRLMMVGIEGQEKGGGLSEYHAKQTAAEDHGVSFATITRAFETYKAAFPEGDDHLMIDEDDLPDPD